MRLIDAEWLSNAIHNFFNGKISLTSEEDIQAYINATPTVCDIDAIRAEIERLHYHPKLDFIKNDEVVEMALDIIDSYIKEEEEKE